MIKSLISNFDKLHLIFHYFQNYELKHSYPLCEKNDHKSEQFNFTFTNLILKPPNHP